MPIEATAGRKPAVAIIIMVWCGLRGYSYRMKHGEEIKEYNAIVASYIYSTYTYTRYSYKLFTEGDAIRKTAKSPSATRLIFNN